MEENQPSLGDIWFPMKLEHTVWVHTIRFFGRCFERRTRMLSIGSQRPSQDAFLKLSKLRLCSRVWRRPLRALALRLTAAVCRGCALEDDVRGTERPSLYLPSKGRCLTWRSTVSSEPCGRDGTPRRGKTCEGTEILQPRDGVPARCRRRKWPNVEHVFLFFFN